MNLSRADAWFEDSLRCVFCGDALEPSLRVPAGDERLECGLLRCKGCAVEFPVVEGIPIIGAPEGRYNSYAETLDEIVLEGPRIADVTAAVRRRDPDAALALLLNPFRLDNRAWSLTLTPPRSRQGPLPRGRDSGGGSASRVPGDVRTAGRGGAALDPLRRLYRGLRTRYRRQMLPRWRRELSEFLRSNRDELSAHDVLALFYRRFSGHEDICNYFMYRFGQPRHLAALSLLRLARASDGPILDVACGAGHLTHYLSYGRTTPVVGIDRDFFRLYVAQRYIAPQARFVCVMADAALPFRESAFDFVLCSDAFHYFRHKPSSVREFRRVATDRGTIMLTRVGNRAVEPREGYELDVQGYRQLLGDLPHAVVAEEALRAAYLAREGVDLTPYGSHSDVTSEKWLSFVATRRADLLVRQPPFSGWPHAVGRPRVNPLYVPVGPATPTGQPLRFEFPSAWFAYEDAAYREYASARCEMSASLLEAIERGEWTDEMEGPLARFEIVGMPDRFL